MKLLVQKSLKTELRLKRYKVLKLQGLDCKIAWVRFKIELKTGARSELYQKPRASVQTSWDLT
jgi:hypothetical protein